MRPSKAIAFCTLALCLITCSSVCVRAQIRKPAELVDGRNINLEGTLRLRRIGNQAFLTIQTRAPYLARFYSGTSREVHEVQIILEGQNDALRKYIGQHVSAAGRLQLEETSSYYFNGTLLLAESVKLSDHSVLTPQKSRSAKQPPITLEKFHARVTFDPKSNQFTYVVCDSAGRQLSPANGYLSCSLNGPGDVMNCFCVTGFTVTGLGKMNVLAQKPDIADFAQFRIPENLRRPISKAVECTRTSVH